MTVKTIDYTIDHFDSDVDLLHEWIKSEGEQYDVVVGLARGGMPLATAMSYRLDLPLDMITWQTRSGTHKNIPRRVQDAVEDGEKILLVDDIIDSGRAMGEVLHALGSPTNVHLAVIYQNIAQPLHAKYAARNINRQVEKRWINFWWERTNNNV